MTELELEEETGTDVPDAIDIDAMTKEEYKEHVREIALRVVQDQGWCSEGAASTFRLLGLEPPPIPRTFTFRVPVGGLAEFSFQATSLEDALEQWRAYRRDSALGDPISGRYTARNQLVTATFEETPTEYRDARERGAVYNPITPTATPIDVNV